MFITRKEVLCSFFLVVVAAFFPRTCSQSLAQSASSREWQREIPCVDKSGAVLPTESEEGEWAQFSDGAPGLSVVDCPASLALSRLRASDSDESPLEFRRHPPQFAEPPAAPRAAAVPQHSAGPAVNPSLAAAHEAALEILSAENACSAWFRQGDPEVVAIFQSLNFRIDPNGSDQVIQERSGDGRWIEHGPFIARTTQSTGPGTIVTLNANGAFFRSRNNLYRLGWPGGTSFATGNRAFTQVGPYDGGTFRAQIVTLLHELAHVVGAIPEDDSSKFGLARSHTNTATVLRYCKSSVDTFTKHNAIILSSAALGDPHRR
jgi:hypothetical protein